MKPPWKSDTGSSLSGAQFTVVGGGKNETVTVNGTLTLDLAGWADGSYTVTETTAPSGYELNSTPQTFTISSDTVNPAELTFINSKTPPPPDDPPPPPPTEVTILKVEYSTDTPLSGAEFKITRTSHWEKRLVDPDEDDTGEFYDDDNGDALNSGDDGYHHNVEDLSDDVWEWIEVHEWENVGSFVTGENGTFPLTLEPGSFIVEEVVPPAGLYEDKISGSLSAKRFEILSREYEAEQENLETEIARIEASLAAFAEDTGKAERFIGIVRKYTDFSELTASMLNEYVEKILVFEAEKINHRRKQRVEVHLNFIGQFNVPLEVEPTEEEPYDPIARRREIGRNYYYRHRNDVTTKYQPPKGGLREIVSRFFYAQNRKELTNMANY